VRGLSPIHKQKMGICAAGDEEQPANAPDTGPLGLGVMPATRAFFRDIFMRHFFTNLMEKRLAEEPEQCWTLVCHASPQKPELNALNVAMPDLSCEYWVTFVPAGKKPVFRVSFPSWALYTALTAYGTDGLPITSVNGLQAAEGGDSRITPIADGGIQLRLMDGHKWDGPMCAIFRIYRPDDVEILPHDQLPAVYFIDIDSGAAELDLEVSTQAEALRRGNEFLTLTLTLTLTLIGGFETWERIWR